MILIYFHCFLTATVWGPWAATRGGAAIAFFSILWIGEVTPRVSVMNGTRCKWGEGWRSESAAWALTGLLPETGPSSLQACFSFKHVDTVGMSAPVANVGMQTHAFYYNHHSLRCYSALLRSSYWMTG